MKTKAAILENINSALVIDEIEVPPLRSGQVLVKMKFSGLCGTQLLEISGGKGPDDWLPHCLGHEAIGEVVEIGSEVDKVEVGDEVILTWIKGKGFDAGGTQYKWGKRLVNSGPVTTLQEFSVVSENRIVRKPNGLSALSSVLLGCAAMTGMGAVINVLNVKREESVAIWGAGGVGLCACMACLNKKIKRTVVIDPSVNRRNLAKSFGATEVFDPCDLNFEPELKTIFSRGVDCAVEATGDDRVLSGILRQLSNQGGKVVIIGNARKGSSVNIDLEEFNKGKSLMGTWGGDSDPDRDIPLFAEILRNYENEISALFSSPYSLEDINVAVQDMRNGLIGRGLIAF